MACSPWAATEPSTVMTDAQALRRQEPVCPEPDVYA